MLEEEAEPSAESIEWGKFYKIYKRNSLSFMTVNARSLSNKFTEFTGHLSGLKHKLAFILVTESWLNESKDFLLEIPGYNSYYFYRNRRRGGGLKFYVLKSWKPPLTIHVKLCCYPQIFQESDT